jgi:uncharacterized protein (TIGR02594 family)
MTRAVDVVRRIAPQARPAYLAAFKQGDALLFAHGLITPARLAHFLAQVLHESGALEIDWENMSYSSRRLLQIFGVGRHSAAITQGEAQLLAHRPEAIAERVYGLGNPHKARELGNIESGDGFYYRGGGLLQTTGRANYRRMGQKCGVDFEGQPDLLLAAEHALKPALCEWTEARLNAFADCEDILSISRAINLGNPRVSRRPNGMEDRVAWYARVRQLIDRVDFDAAAGELAPQTVPVHPLPSEEDVAQSIVAIVGGQILRFGDRGSQVQAVQRALGQLGYGLSGSGNYGANTQAAVADFQARHGLEVDAEVGAQTARAVDAALASAHEAGKPADGGAAPGPGTGPPRAVAPASVKTSGPSSASQTLEAGVGDRMLRTGDTGDLVRAVQLALTKLGYDLKGTGNYGPKTQSVVADFQARHGLEVDGEVGSETAKAIDAVLASATANKPAADGADATPPLASGTPVARAPLTSLECPAQSGLAALLGDRSLRVGDEGDYVRASQLALAKLGYDLKGTGTFGGATDTAVTHFQQSRGLEVDGEIGPQTAAAIDAALAGAGSVSAPTTAQSAVTREVPVGTAGQPIWLLEGLKWLNTKEASGDADNPEILEWARGEGGAIAKSYNSDSIPWCALYANMVLTKVGLQGTETLWALDWSNWGAKLKGPAVGAFAPMKRQGGGHIAIVAGRDQHGNLMCLGGNQSDAVNIKPFPADRPVSFRWPKEVPPPTQTGLNTLPLVASDGRVSAREA